MIKATLQYTDCLRDGQKVYDILTRNKAIITSTKHRSSATPMITILITDYDHLCSILNELNARCAYTVHLVRYKTLKEK